MPLRPSVKLVENRPLLIPYCTMIKVKLTRLQLVDQVNTSRCTEVISTWHQKVQPPLFGSSHEPPMPDKPCLGEAAAPVQTADMCIL